MRISEASTFQHTSVHVVSIRLHRIYIYICIHAYIHTYMHIYIRTHMHAYEHRRSSSETSVSLN
jgi:hypothetical protein